jgi:spoIIIJ-associated protein
MAENNLVKIKENIEEILRIIGFEGEALISDQQDNLIRINIKNDQARYLIGRNGENLMALQHLLRAMTSRQLAAGNFTIDINDYQRNRLEELKDVALSLADEVVRRQAPRSLAPMNAYERRIVHMALSNFSGVVTDSEGTGEERRIVIKPAK